MANISIKSARNALCTVRHGHQDRIAVVNVQGMAHTIVLGCDAGTLLAAQLALEHGLACSTAGGTHHAAPSCGSGFCVINDLAITAKLLLRTSPRVDRVLVLDLDVHQGVPGLANRVVPTYKLDAILL
jgi:acetoin utilization deacetylase AcuC-like enzyme